MNIQSEISNSDLLMLMALHEGAAQTQTVAELDQLIADKIDAAESEEADHDEVENTAKETAFQEWKEKYTNCRYIRDVCQDTDDRTVHTLENGTAFTSLLLERSARSLTWFRSCLKVATKLYEYNHSEEGSKKPITFADYFNITLLHLVSDPTEKNIKRLDSIIANWVPSRVNHELTSILLWRCSNIRESLKHFDTLSVWFTTSFSIFKVPTIVNEKAGEIVKAINDEWLVKEDSDDNFDVYSYELFLARGLKPNVEMIDRTLFVVNNSYGLERLAWYTTGLFKSIQLTWEQYKPENYPCLVAVDYDDIENNCIGSMVPVAVIKDLIV